MSESMILTMKRVEFSLPAICLVIMSVLTSNVWAADSSKLAESKSAAAVSKDKSDQKQPAVTIKLRPGAKVYVDNCRICHGDKGDGNTRARGGLRPPPRDFTSIEAALELTESRMIKSVTEGRPGTGMMSHKDRLSEQQIKDVVKFIQTSFLRKPNKNDLVAKNIAGRKIYTKNCSVCHGDSGNTAVWAKSGLNPPPRDFTAAESTVLTRKRMIHSVTKGRPGTGMMPFTTKLNEKEIEQVVDYIREVFLGKGRSVAGGNVSLNPMSMLPQDNNHARMRQGGVVNPPKPLAPKPQAAVMPSVSRPTSDPHANMAMKGAAPANNPATAGPHSGPGALPKGGGAMTQAPLPAIVDADMSLAMPGGLKGDRKAGKKFFLSNCFTCHGVKGEGNGPRAHFNTPRPRNFTTADAARMFNRVRLFDSITNGRVGTVMPAWSKVLTPQQIADVAEFVFQEFIQAKKAKKTSEKKTDKKKAS